MTVLTRFAGFSLAAVLLLGSVLAHANSGTVAQLSGTLSVRKPDGSIRILSQRSEIVSGDTVTTERDSYAQIRFADGGQVTLKPNTSVAVENFRFNEARPQDDSMLFNLVRGGLRAVTGLVGRRGNADAYRMGTATATIGIRGTTFSADDCVNNRGGQCSSLDTAVYVSVADGEIIVTSTAGSLALAAGQFGLIAPGQRPLFLSTDPGLVFTPPVSFIQSVMAGSAVNAGKNLECVVRR